MFSPNRGPAGLHSCVAFPFQFTLWISYAGKHDFLSPAFLCNPFSLSLFLSFPEKCLQGNGGCSHQCAVIPSKGVVCSCPDGLNLGSDNRTCETVDYCTRHLKCSQICEQHKTVVKCSCYPGWTLDLDGESCSSIGTSMPQAWHWRYLIFKRTFPQKLWLYLHEKTNVARDQIMLGYQKLVLSNRLITIVW